jgi:Crp-like helix-turn-helix domain
MDDLTLLSKNALLQALHDGEYTPLEGVELVGVHTHEQMTHDRVGRDTFPLTQEFLPMMLGVRRSEVTLAASAFADAGFTKYSRGTMTILDRAGLEKETCECYAVERRQFHFPQAQ